MDKVYAIASLCLHQTHDTIGRYVNRGYGSRASHNILRLLHSGDGWSGGILTYVRYGCIPFIIQDGVDMPFQRVGGGANNGKAQPVLDYSKFSVRLPESSIENIDDVLFSMSKVGVCVELEQRKIGFGSRSFFFYIFFSSLAPHPRPCKVQVTYRRMTRISTSTFRVSLGGYWSLTIRRGRGSREAITGWVGEGVSAVHGRRPSAAPRRSPCALHDNCRLRAQAAAAAVHQGEVSRSGRGWERDFGGG